MVVLTLTEDVVKSQLMRMRRYFFRRQHSIAYETWLLLHTLWWEYKGCRLYDLLVPAGMERMMNLDAAVPKLILPRTHVAVASIHYRTSSDGYVHVDITICNQHRVVVRFQRKNKHCIDERYNGKGIVAFKLVRCLQAYHEDVLTYLEMSSGRVPTIVITRSVDASS